MFSPCVHSFVTPTCLTSGRGWTEGVGMPFSEKVDTLWEFATTLDKLLTPNALNYLGWSDKFADGFCIWDNAAERMTEWGKHD
jgi:hypothetical protein